MMKPVKKPIRITIADCRRQYCPFAGQCRRHSGAGEQHSGERVQPECRSPEAPQQAISENPAVQAPMQSDATIPANYPKHMKGLTDIPGIQVGHASDYEALTGCTVILCERGAAGGVDVRGSATGTEDSACSTRCTSPNASMPLCSRAEARSAWKPPPGCAISRTEGRRLPDHRRSCPARDGGYPGDLGLGKKHIRPSREMGETAAAAASPNAVPEGCVGAGTGATVGKLFGMKRAMKSGIGSYTVTLPDGVLVSSLAAVNAFGDVIDPASSKIVAGARRAPESTEFANTAEAMKTANRVAGLTHQNTTLVAVATNAQLSKVGASKVAEFGSAGMARAISPVWTMFDGISWTAFRWREESRHQCSGSGRRGSGGAGDSSRREIRENDGRCARTGSIKLLRQFAISGSTKRETSMISLRT